MSRPSRPLASLLAAGVLATMLAGCASDWSTPRAAPSPLGTPGEGFLPAETPAPESTLSPSAGSWDDVRPGAGYRVVLLTAGDDAPTQAVVDAVRDWASDNAVDLRTVTAGAHAVDAVVEAIDLAPDLIVGAGTDLVDALALVSASHLDRQFLLVGSQIAEPTENVTAVEWTGATFRGEGLGSASAYDPDSFTPARCEAAVRAGVAAVLYGLTGVVLHID